MLLAFILLLLVFSIGLSLPRKALKPFLFSMVARLGISIANVVLKGNMIGADADAHAFFSQAVYLSANMHSLNWDLNVLLNGTEGFINVHALVQFVGGPDFFLSHAFSLLGAAVGLWLLTQSWLLLFPQGKKYLGRVILLYTLYPSILTLQSYILREVWQNVCILGLGWLALKIKAKGWSQGRILGLVTLTIAGSLLHTAMPLVMPLLLIISIMLANKVSLTRLYSPIRLVKVLIVLLVLSALILPVISQSPHFKAFGELIENTDQYSQSALQDARAEYGKLFFANQPWTIIPTFLAYELMPLPFQIKTPSDLVAFIQNLFRVWLLWVYWRRRQYLDKNTLQSVNMLLLMWLVIDLVYATGTINWGTAARHHTKSLALLLLSGLVVWARFRKSHTLSIREQSV
ncbi:hypothetical protein CEP07_01750 [Cylindrospermopsis raciborskii S01]|nr:hypothetical protein CEP07_01750 [Cylindrospermopsis raciborskii S01]